MNTFAHEGYIDDLHIPQVCFGGEIALHPRPKRLAQEKAKYSQRQGDRQQQKTRPRGSRTSERQPGHRSGQERRGDKICPAAGVNGKSAFSSTEARICFLECIPDIFRAKLAENEETGRVGMSAHIDLMRACQHMQRGVFERMIPSCFEDIREI